MVGRAVLGWSCAEVGVTKKIIAVGIRNDHHATLRGFVPNLTTFTFTDLLSLLLAKEPPSDIANEPSLTLCPLALLRLALSVVVSVREIVVPSIVSHSGSPAPIATWVEVFLCGYQAQQLRAWYACS